MTPTRRESEPASPGLGVATPGGSAEPGEVASLGEAVGVASLVVPAEVVAAEGSAATSAAHLRSST